MALTTRLKKLEQPAFEAWNKLWKGFFDKLLAGIPSKAEPVWNEGEALAVQLETLPEEEKQSIAAKQDEENHRLFKLLDLECDPWLLWAEEVRKFDEQIVIVHEQKLKPDLSFTPSTLPKPPCDPRQVLKLMETFDYPIDFIGNARFFFALCLAEAHAVWEAHEGLD
jgi:hypothetical protein